jgi:nucleoside-diphosphate-sugar epimerase
VAFSTTSIASKVDSPDLRERETINAIVTQEAALRDSCSSLGSELCLLRPTLVYGCGMDQNISLLARWIKRFGFVPISRSAQGLRQPVHVADLAQTAVSAMLCSASAGLVSAVCGGSTLTYRAMVERIFDGLSRPRRIIALPAPLLAAAAGVGRTIPALRSINSEMIRRQSRDLVFDDQPAREKLAHQPRRFSPGSSDFRRPDHARLRRMALPESNG